MARPVNPNSQRQQNMIQRRRGSAATVLLPPGGHKGNTPPWPISEEPAQVELELWTELWKTPQAAMWAESGYDRTVARYVKIYCLATDDPRAGYMSELRQLEDRLGLSALGLKRLGWEIGEAREPVQINPGGRWSELRAAGEMPTKLSQ